MDETGRVRKRKQDALGKELVTARRTCEFVLVEHPIDGVRQHRERCLDEGCCRRHNRGVDFRGWHQCPVGAQPRREASAGWEMAADDGDVALARCCEDERSGGIW